MFPRLDMYSADPAQHVIAAGYDLGDLSDLSYLSDLSVRRVHFPPRKSRIAQ